MKNENGVAEDEENFEEAIKNVNTALNLTKVQDLILFKCFFHQVQWAPSGNVSFLQISSSVEDLFNSEQCNIITSQVFTRFPEIMIY